MMRAPSIEARQSLLLRLVDWYQHAFAGRPSPCRFTPSCSSYAREALETYGTRRGLWLTIRRLARCRPFGPSGFDPVPLPHDGRPCRHRHGSTPPAISRVPSGISVVPSGIPVVKDR